jgi:Ser-tRNA(Ala) deacylase AlaX
MKHAKLHSAGHLIDVAMEKLGYGHLEPGKGFHFPKGSYVEYKGVVETEARDKLKDALNAELKNMIENSKEEDWSESNIYDHDEAKEKLEEIPSYFTDGERIRYVRLCKDDKGCWCGGTHVKHIKDIKGIDITKVKKNGKNTKISYSVID